jgi:hypothetical protein
MDRTSEICKLTFLHILRSPEINLNIIYSSVLAPHQPRVFVTKTILPNGARRTIAVDCENLNRHVNSLNGEYPAIWNVVHIVTTVLCRSDHINVLDNTNYGLRYSVSIPYYRSY